MQRLRDIEDATRTHRRRLRAAYERLREECGDDRDRFAQRWHAVARRWRFDELNELIREHNEWYPVESGLPLDPRTRDYVRMRGPRTGATAFAPRATDQALGRELSGRGRPAALHAAAARHRGRDPRYTGGVCGRAYEALREECGDDRQRFAQRWHAIARRWRFDELNELIREHNEWYPVESGLPLDPRTRDYVRMRGRSYRRDELGPEWVLDRFPA